MTDDPAGRLLEEWELLEPAPRDAVLAALRRAQLVEDVFGITLTDHQILHLDLSDPAALRDLVAGSAATS